MRAEPKSFEWYIKLIFNFGLITFALKFLDLNKVGFIELGTSENKNLVIGSLGIVVVFAMFGAIITVIRDAATLRIEDLNKEKSELPKFESKNEDSYLPKIILLTSPISYYFSILFPILFGGIIIWLVRCEISYTWQVIKNSL